MGKSYYEKNVPCRGLCDDDDDDELLVRASAVLKSQGPENWSRGRPGLRWARTNSRSVRDASCGKTRRGKNRRWGDVMWRRRSGVLVVCGILFVRKWGEGPVTAHKKAFRSGKGAHVRGVSPVPGRLLRGVSAGVSQRSGRSAGSCPVCSSAARGDAAGPGSRVGNHRCRLGWESARSGSVGLGLLLRRFAGAAPLDAVGSGGVGGRSEPSVRAASGGAATVAGCAGMW